jgi:hypothetical protein
MYVCTYVCVYVCMYVLCLYVCIMYVLCMYVCMYVSMNFLMSYGSQTLKWRHVNKYKLLSFKWHMSVHSAIIYEIETHKCTQVYKILHALMYIVGFDFRMPRKRLPGIIQNYRQAGGRNEGDHWKDFCLCETRTVQTMVVFPVIGNSTFDMQYANYYNNWTNRCVLLYQSAYCTVLL